MSWLKFENINVKTNNKSKEYKIEIICNNIVYAKKLEKIYLLGLYYLILLKNYLKKKIS